MAGWERGAGAADLLRGTPGAERRHAFPHDGSHHGPRDGPVVWKDPRLCLLLPLWRAVLPEPVAPILVWRAPYAVARSLRARQGFPLSLGLALWERYTRHALAALSGGPAYVLRYEDLLRDTTASVAGMASWLGSHGVACTATAAALDGAAASVSATLATSTAEGELPGVVADAATTLGSLAGGHDHLPDVAMGDVPRWMEDAITQRREYEALYARYMRYVRLRRRIPFLRRAVAP